MTLFLILEFKRGVVQLDRITDFGSVGWGFESSLLTNVEPMRNCGFIFYPKGIYLNCIILIINNIRLGFEFSLDYGVFSKIIFYLCEYFNLISETSYMALYMF